MALFLLCYLRPADKNRSSSNSSHSSSNSSHEVPKVHDEVCSQVQNVQYWGKKQGQYQKLTVASAVGKFKRKNFKESSIRDW